MARTKKRKVCESLPMSEPTTTKQTPSYQPTFDYFLVKPDQAAFQVQANTRRRCSYEDIGTPWVGKPMDAHKSFEVWHDAVVQRLVARRAFLSVAK